MASGKHHIKVRMMVIPKHTSMHHGDKHNDSNELNKMASHNKLKQHHSHMALCNEDIHVKNKSIMQPNTNNM